MGLLVRLEGVVLLLVRLGHRVCGRRVRDVGKDEDA